MALMLLARQVPRVPPLLLYLLYVAVGESNE